MYEIWLALNIGWETIAPAWPLVAALGLAWLLLVAVAWRVPGAGWRKALPAALLLALAVALLAFAALPWLTRSSLAELRYWVDWFALAGLAAAAGGLVGAFAWPALALRFARRGERTGVPYPAT